MKIIELIFLRGNDYDDNKLVQKEKIKFILNKIKRLFFKKEIPFTMGETLEDSVTVKNSYGIFKCRKETFDLHIISASYEYLVYRLFKQLAKKSKIIVDAGANIGKYSILANKINPKIKIFAIEPQKENFKILSENKELNDANITLMNVALDTKKGKTKLGNPRGNPKNRGGYSFFSSSSDYEFVQTETLDSLFSSIDLIKIDTEGAELRVLEGAKKLLSQKKIKNIIVEVNDPKVKELLKSYGYFLKRIQYNNYLAYLV